MPARCPSTRGRWRCAAQRPLPSMMMATCAGSWSKLTCRASVSSGDPGGIDARQLSSDIQASSKSKPGVYKVLGLSCKQGRSRRRRETAPRPAPSARPARDRATPAGAPSTPPAGVRGRSRPACRRWSRTMCRRNPSPVISYRESAGSAKHRGAYLGFAETRRTSNHFAHARRDVAASRLKAAKSCRPSSSRAAARIASTSSDAGHMPRVPPLERAHDVAFRCDSGRSSSARANRAWNDAACFLRRRIRDGVGQVRVERAQQRVRGHRAFERERRDLAERMHARIGAPRPGHGHSAPVELARAHPRSDPGSKRRSPAAASRRSRCRRKRG